MAFDRSWQARWIWIGEDATPPATIFQLDAPPRPPDTVVMFRRTVDLDDPPATAPCRITCDGRYQLFVNGVRLGRGPIRGEPALLAWDEYDLAAHLQPGRNAIAVLARNFGQPTMYWKPAQPVGQLGFGSLLFEARLGDDLVVSDATWRVHLAPYERAQPGRWAGPPAVEVVDGRAFPEGWTRAEFCDEAWQPAATLALAGLGIHHDGAPTDPFGMLHAAPIGQLEERVVHPARVVGRGEALEVLTRHPLDALPEDGVGRRCDEPAPGVLELGAGQWVTLDFGAITNSHPTVGVTAGEGTVIDLTCGEDLTEDGRPVVAPRRWSMRYTVAGREAESIEALEPVGFRYLQLAVRAGEAASVDVAALYRHYPRPAGASFSCDDTVLGDLWRVGAQTLDACSVDAFLDCPGREQRAWMGDAYVETLVSLACNPDTGLVTHNAELLRQGVRADGLRPMVGGGDFTDSVTTIPDFSLHWIRTVARVYEHLGDITHVERMWPRILDALGWFEWHRGDDDLLIDLAGWVFVDWAQTARDRSIAAADALYAMTCDDAAMLADALDESGSARRLRERAARSRTAFERYWDADRGVYVDAARPGGPAARRVSQQTNVLAILSGAAPRERWSGMLDRILDPERLIMTRHPGDGGPQKRRLLHQFLPAQEFGGGRFMDEEAEVVLAQPFFCHFLHQALATAGRRDALVASVRRWEELLDRGDQVFQEYWSHVPGHGSRCHAWSATPTYDLTTHVLGVRRVAVGWSRVAVEPWFGDLTRLQGRVPTPLGAVEVDLTRGTGGTVTLPATMTGIYRLGDDELTLGPGATRVPA